VSYVLTCLHAVVNLHLPIIKKKKEIKGYSFVIFIVYPTIRLTEERSTIRLTEERSDDGRSIDL
jgi:hypothetical protein